MIQRERFGECIMAKKKRKKNMSDKLRAWVAARRRHHLSHAHVQMARELGMNPGKLGKIDNHDQEPWKTPLQVFIEDLYEKRFGRRRPEKVMTVAQIAEAQERKKAEKRRRKEERRHLREGVQEESGRG